ncbi:MAG: insulinase family protein [Microscillaceae bacterium]|nr:insulinase family protein [Microscillaceae bacterium]MDW8460120.1 pitrilysin family protein [Cytophagales bacterium]
MIQFLHDKLPNGLELYFIPDHTTQMAAFNLLYNVGSKHEDEQKTGFAHLFEHLMFGGSQHIPSYDEALQAVGGENNAFTSPDVTNYYITLPAVNLETAFWLESDRMLSLSFNPEVLEVQKKVVIEEFKQRYLNQPYGDAWLHLRPLAYQVHPYRWATIGKDISHIEKATMDDVQNFFFRYYRPNNAILVVAGNSTWEQVQFWANKWFGDIPPKENIHQPLPQEPPQTQARSKTIEANVPLEAIYKVYHSPARQAKDYFASDLLSDILGRGKSSRLYQKLVKEKEIFNTIQAYITGAIDTGLLVIHGKLNPTYTLAEGNEAIEQVITELQQELISEQELEKVKNQAEASLVFSEVELLNRAMNLAYYALLGMPEAVNLQGEEIQAVTTAQIQEAAQKYLRPENCSTLYYQKKP